MAIIGGVAVWKLKLPEPKKVMRFTHELPEGQQFTQAIYGIGGTNFAVSPDGGQIVYGATEGLFLRSVDALDARLLTGTDKDSVQPCFSPDGQWIGYLSRSDRKLKKVAISGGASVVLCDIGPRTIGASWNADNTILYSDALKGIMRVSANAGTPELLIKGSIDYLAKEGMPMMPQMLPDEKTLLFTNMLSMTPFNTEIAMQSLKSGERKVLIKSGVLVAYLPTGHLVYLLPNNGSNIFNNSLIAVPFDLDRLEVTGGSVPLVEGISVAAISNSGTLVYTPGAVTVATQAQRTLVWVDRKGKEEPIAAPTNDYRNPKISPDGTRVAVSIHSGNKSDIWIWDFVREAMTRLTFNEANISPLWTPNAQRIAFVSLAIGQFATYWKAADGTGEEEKIVSASDRVFFPWSWSSDGKVLVLNITSSGTVSTFDIGTLSMEGDRQWRPLIKEKYDEVQPKISPDGRWMAYVSLESGQSEVYVRPFPEVNKGKWQISTSGGDVPLWSPDDRELFYRNGDSVMAVPVQTEPIFKAGKPSLLFQGKYVPRYAQIQRPWDIHPDGKRFLLIKPQVSTGAAPAVAAPRPKINIVVNWFEELKQRVPVK